MPRLYSYVVARDYGFAPNPFFGFCTLATCKPEIRRTAAVGDWIIGTGSKRYRRDSHIVYAMCLRETMSFSDYWHDARFRDKRPNMHASLRRAFGDNIYFRDSATGEWRQVDSHHSYSDGTQNVKNIHNDTRVDRVLVSDDFIYWGGSGPRIPPSLGREICKGGQGHKCKFSDNTIHLCIGWLRASGETGYRADPLNWTERKAHRVVV